MSKVVLVVDDEPAILDLTADVLEDLGCEVITARTGSEALAKLAADERITILMTDVQMPGMDGYELAERARHVRPHLRILALSGRDAGGKGIPIVRKPFTKAQLAEAMAKTTGVC